MAQVVKEVNIKAQLLIRLRVDDSHSELPLGSKFGASIAEADMLITNALKMDLQVVGVSFHVGSGCTDSIAYKNAVTLAHSVFKMAESKGVTFTLLDIGGGFPGVDDASDGISIFEIADALNPVLDELFPVGCGVNIISEPGRYFVAGCQDLAVRIMRVRYVDSEDEEETEEALEAVSPTSESDTGAKPSEVDPQVSVVYYISEGVFGAFKDSVLLQVSFIPQVLQTKLDKDAPPLPSKLIGPSVHSHIDIVSKCMMLPPLEEGDWLLYEVMGAYTDSLKSVSADETFKVYVYLHYIYDIQCALMISW